MLEQQCQMEAMMRDKLQQQLHENVSLTTTLLNQVISLTKTTETQAAFIQQMLLQQQQQLQQQSACSSAEPNANEQNIINNEEEAKTAQRKRKADEHAPGDDTPDTNSGLPPMITAKKAATILAHGLMSSEVTRNEIKMERPTATSPASTTATHHRNSFVSAVAGSDSEMDDTDVDSDIDDPQTSPSPGKEEGIKRKVHSKCHIPQPAQSLLFLELNAFFVVISAWDERFAQLLQFYKKHGHFRVPTKPDGGFYHWVYEQRRAKDSMSVAQRKQLDDVGFTWDLLVRNSREEVPAKWGKCFVQVQEFVKQHGHCQIPTDTNLYKWLYKQRNNRKKGMINKKQEEMLSSLGFAWETGHSSSSNNNNSNNNYSNHSNNSNNSNHNFGSINASSSQ